MIIMMISDGDNDDNLNGGGGSGENSWGLGHIGLQ
jgi:hypothetical protein